MKATVSLPVTPAAAAMKLPLAAGGGDLTLRTSCFAAAVGVPGNPGQYDLYVVGRPDPVRVTATTDAIVEPAAKTEDVPKIKCALQIHLAEKDERINAGYPAYEAALKAAGVKYELHMYPGTQHGFNNNTTPRFDEAAAKLAMSRTYELFNKQLRN